MKDHILQVKSLYITLNLRDTNFSVLYEIDNIWGRHTHRYIPLHAVKPELSYINIIWLG